MIALPRAIGGRLFEFETTASGWPTVRFSRRDNAPKAVSSQWQAMERGGTEPVAQNPWCWDSAVLPLAMFKCVFE